MFQSEVKKLQQEQFRPAEQVSISSQEMLQYIVLEWNMIVHERSIVPARPLKQLCLPFFSSGHQQLCLPNARFFTLFFVLIHIIIITSRTNKMLPSNQLVVSCKLLFPCSWSNFCNRHKNEQVILNVHEMVLFNWNFKFFQLFFVILWTLLYVNHEAPLATTTTSRMNHTFLSWSTMKLHLSWNSTCHCNEISIYRIWEKHKRWEKDRGRRRRRITRKKYSQIYFERFRLDLV